MALQSWGLDPATDIQFVQLGGVPEILAGMQGGAVVGGVYSPPTNVLARSLVENFRATLAAGRWESAARLTMLPVVAAFAGMDRAS